MMLLHASSFPQCSATHFAVVVVVHGVVRSYVAPRSSTTPRARIISLSLVMNSFLETSLVLLGMKWSWYLIYVIHILISDAI